MLENIKNGDLVKLEFDKINECLGYIPQTELERIRQFYPNQFNAIQSSAPQNPGRALIWLFTEFLNTNATFCSHERECNCEKLGDRMIKLINNHKNDYQFYSYWIYAEKVNTTNTSTNNALLEILKTIKGIGSIGGGNTNDDWFRFRFLQVQQMRESMFVLPQQFLEFRLDYIQPPLQQFQQFRNFNNLVPRPLNNQLAANVVTFSSVFKPANVYHISAKCEWKENTNTCTKCGTQFCHTKKTKDYINLNRAYLINEVIYPAGQSGTETNYYVSFLDLFSKTKAGDVVLLNESIKGANVQYPCSFNIAINDMIAHLAKKKVCVVLCAGNNGIDISSQAYKAPEKSEAIVIGAVQRVSNRSWKFDSNFASGPEIDFYVQTHEGFFSQSSAASAFVARKIKEMQDSIRSNQENMKLSVDEIKVRLRQETELNIINGVGISFFSSGTTAAL